MGHCAAANVGATAAALGLRQPVYSFPRAAIRNGHPTAATRSPWFSAATQARAKCRALGARGIRGAASVVPRLAGDGGRLVFETCLV